VGLKLLVERFRSDLLSLLQSLLLSHLRSGDRRSYNKNRFVVSSGPCYEGTIFFSETKAPGGTSHP